MIFPGGANPQRGRGTPEYNFSGRPTALDPPMVTYVIEKVVPPGDWAPGKSWIRHCVTIYYNPSHCLIT